ncbi:glucosyl transferase, partial [Neisseria gonorrhoeae]
RRELVGLYGVPPERNQGPPPPRRYGTLLSTT